MPITFTVELGNQVSFKVLPEAFEHDLPKQVAILAYHKQLLALADVYIEDNAIKATAGIPAEFFGLAPVPVFEVDDEVLLDDGKTIKITKATLLHIGLLPHKQADAVRSLQDQLA